MFNFIYHFAIKNIHKNTVFVVVGPTAVGKTSFAIQLAKHYNTQIISADSRQCFKELNIGVARPSFEELKLVHHYFIASHSIHQEVNAGIFEKYALVSVDEIFKNNNVAVMVGGTGLYVNTFCNGIDEMPEIALEIRNKIVADYEENGLQWLQNEIEKKDVEFWQTAEQQNPQRLMRALEVFEATGKSINSFRNKKNVERGFNIVKIGLELPKELLHKNINTRVDKMIEEGQIEEAKSLMQFQHLNALQTVGYKELFDFFKNNFTIEQAVERIKINTRQYAKRQMTWFKKDADIKWFDASNKIDFDLLSI